MNKSFDVLIVGGGVVGLTAALAMAKLNHSVAVIDAGDFSVDLTSMDARVYAINMASKKLLTQLDVWQRLDPTRVVPYQKMHVWDSVRKAAIEFDSRQIAAANLGAIIEESVIKQALLEEIAKEASIVLFKQSTVEEIKECDDSIQISSPQQVWIGQLLMVADGAHSPLRQLLNIDLTSWSYHQQSVVASVTTDKPHQSTAFQVFNPDGPLAFLPLAHPNQCSIVWSTNVKHASDLLLLEDTAFNEEITKAFANKLGSVKLLNQRQCYPLQMRHVKQYVGKRWLLLGDAAHTIHPLAGLGLNVGLADVASWLSCCNAHKTNWLSKKQLNAYQRERKHAVWQAILLMEGLKRLFEAQFPPIPLIRGLGLNACNASLSIKRLFIDHAAFI